MPVDDVLIFPDSPSPLSSSQAKTKQARTKQATTIHIGIMGKAKYSRISRQPIRDRAKEQLLRALSEVLSVMKQRTSEDIGDETYLYNMLPQADEEDPLDYQDRQQRFLDAFFQFLAEKVTLISLTKALSVMGVTPNLIKAGISRVVEKSTYKVYPIQPCSTEPTSSMDDNLFEIMRVETVDYSQNYEDLEVFGFEEEEEEDEEGEEEDEDDREYIEKVEAFFESIFHHIFQGLHFETSKFQYEEEEEE